ncbi:YdcF family protein [Pseudoruegeria sp. HB172150]|uniref:YdcF family protein n=1 Tax=Pseudoruegeria sp. HB172150 TaxID=2721164 RepID=UPI00155418FB
MTDDIRQAARTLWTFHSVSDPVEHADVIVGLGSYDLRVADRCARLYNEGYAPRLLFTGATGNWTRNLFPATEAEAFADRATAAGVPPEAIAIETAATNIGENVTFSARLLPDIRTAIFVTKPQTQLRCRATLAAQWPEIRAMVTAPLTAFEDQPTAHHGFRALVCEMVGDVERMRTYPAPGYQAEVAIPHHVLAAFDLLKTKGFTDHLPRAN